MLKGLRRKFVSVMMFITSILLCVLLILLYRFTAASMEAENIQMMQSVTVGMGPGGFSPEISRPDNRLHYFILSRTPLDELIVMGNTSFDLSDENLLVEIYELAAESGQSVGVLEEYSLRYFLHSTPRDVSYIFSDISEEQATLSALRRACWVVGLLAMCIVGLISRQLVGWMIRPVEESWQQQKQFIADASHELKTPLTVILTNTELLTSPDYTAPQKREFTEHIMTMALRMRSLVEGMLDLARVDSGVVKAAFENLNFSELTEDALLPFEPLYFESDRVLESTIEPDIRLKGSARHLEQVIGILLDNAMKYSCEGSTVVLQLQRQGRHALLCVDNPGQEISPEDLTNIFRRFYTVDKARTDGSSYGLGLPIADAIIREHGGRIWAESGDGHNRFYVRLPIN